MTGVEVDPVELHLAGDRVSAATDVAAPALSATTGSDCSGGFPGTSAGAHAALVEAWQRQDRDLASDLYAAADLLHRSAEVYRATDDANEDRLARVTPAPGASPGDHARPALDM